MEVIREYCRWEPEYAKLWLFANAASEECRKNNDPHGLSVENVYFDVSQDWKYTAPITHNRKDAMDTCHSLCPRDYKTILQCDSIKQIRAYGVGYARQLCNGKPGDLTMFDPAEIELD